MCTHTHTVLETTGTISFSGGDMIDTIQDQVVCLDCGKEIGDPAPESLDEIPY